MQLTSVALALAALTATGCPDRGESPHSAGRDRPAPARPGNNRPAADTDPFSTLGLSPPTRKVARGQKIWAAAVDRREVWKIGVYRVADASGDNWKLAGENYDPVAPGSLTHSASRPPPPAGTPVLIQTNDLEFGTFVGTPNEAPGKVVVRFVRGRTPGDYMTTPERVLAIEPGKWTFGAPVVVTRNGKRVRGIVAGDAGDAAQVLVGRNPGAKLELVSKSELRLIDPTHRLANDTRVWFETPLAIDGVWGQGVVRAPLNDGVGYEVRDLKSGQSLAVSWGRIAPSE